MPVYPDTVYHHFVVIIVFSFPVDTPRKQAQKQVTQMRSELAVGDEITTIGGITGVVRYQK